MLHIPVTTHTIRTEAKPINVSNIIISRCYIDEIVVDESALLNNPEFQGKKVTITEADNRKMDIGYITGFNVMDVNITPLAGKIGSSLPILSKEIPEVQKETDNTNVETKKSIKEPMLEISRNITDLRTNIEKLLKRNQQINEPDIKNLFHGTQENNMHFKDFYLEVLVNERPLPEYNLPVDESNLNNTCVSYVTDPSTQKEQYNNFTTYIPVTNPGEHYTIRMETTPTDPSEIIISRLYIDGQFDQVHHLHQQQSSRLRSYFVNYERNKAYFFKFASTSEFDKKDDGVFKVPFPVNKQPNKQNHNQKLYGKPGTITVCFFKGIIVDESALLNKPEFEVKPVKITEAENKNMDIGYITGFDVMDAKIPPSTVTRIVDWNPIAVLHLNYRSADWLAKSGFSLPNLSTDQEIKEEVGNNNVVMEQTKEIPEVQKEIMEVDKTNLETKKSYQAPKVSKEVEKTNVEKKKTNKVYGLPMSFRKIMEYDFKTLEKTKKIDEIQKPIKKVKRTKDIDETANESQEPMNITQEFMEVESEKSTGNETNVLQQNYNLKRNHDEMSKNEFEEK
ncbi:17636_t:CDS:2 [Funneliformis geosporum]|uniref:15626_t:CDS:1 n=1 Tax=Funneliformis geosporum TaxID=1117311 RepID=A0A9W4SAD6_9GLOM|nr:15626_t:CDS:2 [Funneliformis geosporum]CAI2161831.1 17636_t:CDS:2 [Funneliformis geosporum]